MLQKFIGKPSQTIKTRGSCSSLCNSVLNVQCHFSCMHIETTLFLSSSVMMSTMVLLMRVIIQLVANSPPHRMRDNSWPLDAFRAPLLRHTAMAHCNNMHFAQQPHCTRDSVPATHCDYRAKFFCAK